MSAIIELELGAGPTPGTYSVHVLKSIAGGEPSTTISLDIDDVLDDLPQIESSILASSVSARRVASSRESAVQSIGIRLFDAVFSGRIGEVYRASSAVAAERGLTPQVTLRLIAPELAALPWEALYDSEAGRYVSRKEPLVRRVSSPYAGKPAPIGAPLRILGIVSSPRGLETLDVEAEKERLESALAEHLADGSVELVWLADPSWGGLHAALLTGQWHVLHFIGHGGYDEASDEGLIALVGREGRADFVPASSLADLINETSSPPRLVVLNSCQSGSTGTSDLFAGTAATLVHSGINAVVAMQFAVSDYAALAFARSFYISLAAGRRIDEAVRSGRIGILGITRDTLEWITPVLYLGGDDTSLLDASASVGARSAVPIALASTPIEASVFTPPVPETAAGPEPAPVASVPQAAPPVDEPVRAEPERLQPETVEPVRVEPDLVEPVRVEPDLVESARVEPDLVEPRMAERAAAPVAEPMVEAVVERAAETETAPPDAPLDAAPPDAPQPPPRDTPPPLPLEPPGPDPSIGDDARRRRILLLTSLGALGVVAAGAVVAVILINAGAGSPEPRPTPKPQASDTPVEPGPTLTAVAVPAVEPWTETGVDCAPDLVIDVTATGSVVPGTGVTNGPDGLTSAFVDSNVVADVQHAALIGRLGGGDPFFIGSQRTIICPDAGGDLEIGINDVGLENNAGSFDAAVTTRPDVDPTSLAPTTIEVPGTVAWTPTGITCAAGDSYRVSATGFVTFAGATDEQDAGPDGLQPAPDGTMQPGNVLTTAPHRGLITRVGEGEPFAAGSSVTITCPADGALEFGPNDGGVGDNIGAFTVTVTRSLPAVP